MFRLALGKCAATRKRPKRSTLGTRPAMNRPRASEGMPGNRQGLQVQPGGGGRVEAAVSVRTHGARRNRLRQGISKAFARAKVAQLAFCVIHDQRICVDTLTLLYGRTGTCPDVCFRESYMAGVGRYATVDDQAAHGHDRSFHHLPKNLHKAAIRTQAAAPGSGWRCPWSGMTRISLAPIFPARLLRPA